MPRVRRLPVPIAVALVVLATSLLSSCRLIPDPSFADLMAARPGTRTAQPEVSRDVAYGENKGCVLASDVLCSGSQTLDLHRSPVGTGSRRPVLLWVHGGGWTMGDKSEPLPANVLRQLDRGYDVLAVNYRLAPRFPFPAALTDLKLAVRWVKAHAEDHGWDPSRIVVVGHSAGGNLAALVGATPGVTALEPVVSGDLGRQDSSVTAVMAVNGVLDLNDTATSGPVGAAYVRMYVGCTACAPARDASVAGRIGRNAAPLYLVHGAHDPMSKPTQGISVCLLYARADRPCSIDIVDSGPTQSQGHDSWAMINQTEFERFIDRPTA